MRCDIVQCIARGQLSLKEAKTTELICRKSTKISSLAWDVNKKGSQATNPLVISKSKSEEEQMRKKECRTVDRMKLLTHAAQQMQTVRSGAAVIKG